MHVRVAGLDGRVGLAGRRTVVVVARVHIVLYFGDDVPHTLQTNYIEIVLLPSCLQIIEDSKFLCLSSSSFWATVSESIFDSILS